MKIITWNCNMAFRKKAHIILALKPDILIIPECEHPDKLLFKNNNLIPTDTLWFRRNQNKGFAIFSIGNFRFKVGITHIVYDLLQSKVYHFTGERYFVSHSVLGLFNEDNI